jgi:hypothetical protein
LMLLCLFNTEWLSIFVSPTLAHPHATANTILVEGKLIK